jgi:hypothetical protein
MDQHSLLTAPARDTTISQITTRLPPELWFLILRYATYPPFPWFCTSSSSSFRSSEVSDANDQYHSHQNSTLPFHIRLTNHASQLEWKASLTRVCKDWNLWGQQFLWEDLWIASAKDGKVLVGLVCGKRGQVHWRTEQGQAQGRRMGHGQVGGHPSLSAAAHTTQRRRTITVKAGKEKVGFSLKRLWDRSYSKESKPSVTTYTHIHPQTTGSFSPSRRKNIASYIKKLHIETPSMDRCCPSDLISILKKCERLEVFIDLRSVRSGFGFVDVGVGGRSRIMGKENAPTDPEHVPGSIPERHLFPQSCIPSTSDPILHTLLHPTTHQKPTLKHLTFTNYKYDPDDFDGGVWFWEDVCRALNGVQDASQASTLESLEVVMSTSGVGLDCGYGYAQRNLGSTLLNRRFEPGLLTSLDFDINHNPPLSLTLPFLRYLRIPLTSPTLLVVATWSLPSLQSLSLVSIDFTGWRRIGFKNFMEVHGGGLVRFEIPGGGESGEEGWITEREDGPTSSLHHQQQNLHLPSTSPHLKYFICSSNASEWNWETPDWIAPHVLMPEHFGVERIGVWGLEGKVVRGDYNGVGTALGIRRRRRTKSTWSWSRPSTQDESDDDEEHLLEEQPFFMLQEQFGSLLRREAFPSLVCIRDMSWESDLIRKSVGIGCSSEPEMSTVDPATPTPSTKRKQKRLKILKEMVASRFTNFSSSTSSSIPSSPIPAAQTQIQFELQSQCYKIRKFWLGVLERCDRRGVYLEDWMGRRVFA